MLSVIAIVVLCVYLVLIVNAILAVMLSGGQPSRTIAWILFLFMFPVAGLLFYYLLGQNIRGKRFYNRRKIKRIVEKSNYVGVLPHCSIPGIVPHIASLIHFFKSGCESHLLEGNNLRYFTWGKDFFDHMLKDISEAQHHVHLEFFIIEDDTVGKQLRQALVAAAERGVNVRLIYDEIGCWAISQHYFSTMRQAGVEVAAFMPIYFKYLSHRVNYRNHRKLVVIDGRIGYLGGMNIAERYVPNNPDEWLDMHVRMEGFAVYGMQYLFLEDWYVATEQTVSDTSFYPHDAGAKHGKAVQVIGTTPFDDWAIMQMGYNRLFQNARSNICIQTPYFMPPASVLEALQTATMCGVKVSIMVPAVPDSVWMKRMNESYYGDILKAGVELYLYEPGMLHAKTMMVDDCILSVGSINLDFRSLGQTFEDTAIIYDAEETLRVKALFDAAKENCRHLTMAEWKKRPLKRRLIESLMRIFSPLC